MTSTHNSISAALRFAWAAYRRHFWVFTAVQLAMFGLWVVLEILVVAGQQAGLWLWALLHLAFLIAFAGLEAGLLAVCLKARSDGRATLADGFSQLALGPKFLAAQLIYLLILIVGLALLLVPGLYFGTRFAFFGFSVVSERNGLTSSFRHSAALTRGPVGKLGGLLVALLLFNVLGAAVLGVGLLFTLPLSLLTLTAIYSGIE